MRILNLPDVKSRLTDLGAAPVADSRQALAQGHVGRRTFEDRVGDGAQVEARAADKDRHVVARFDRGDGLQGEPGVVAGREIFRRGDEIEQVVRDP